MGRPFPGKPLTTPLKTKKTRPRGGRGRGWGFFWGGGLGGGGAKRAWGDRTGAPRGSGGVPALYRSGNQSRAVSSPGLRKEKAVRAAEEKKPDCAMET